jgi:hypothetical protein
MKKKRQRDRKAAGEIFLASDPLYHCFFGIGDGKGKLLKLLLYYPDSRYNINTGVTKIQTFCFWKKNGPFSLTSVGHLLCRVFFSVEPVSIASLEKCSWTFSWFLLPFILNEYFKP